MNKTGITPHIGGKYNWVGQPERLIYMGLCEPRNGHWHQFAKIEEPTVVWCEVLNADLCKLEETQEHNDATYIAVIQFVLRSDVDEPLTWLRLWNQGDFEACRREWPEAPEECYVGAEAQPNCPACKGNDGDMPCAYPSGSKPGCLRDARLATQVAQPSDTPATTAKEFIADMKQRLAYGPNDEAAIGAYDLLDEFAACIPKDDAEKVCVMNCGPHKDDVRSKAQRMAECTDCGTAAKPSGSIDPLLADQLWSGIYTYGKNPHGVGYVVWDTLHNTVLRRDFQEQARDECLALQAKFDAYKEGKKNG
jgi:hypothetical protein